MEMSYLNGGQEHGARGRGGMPVRGRGVPPAGAHRGRGMPPRGAAARGGVTRGGPARGGAVRGAPGGRGGPPAAPARGAAAPRARPPAAGPPQRMAPPPPHQHTPAAAAESYDEYGYDESYTDTAYESYDNYYSQPQAEPEYYDYGHGETTDSYDSYGQDDWNGTQQLGPGKAPPPSRGAKTPYRDHPYRHPTKAQLSVTECPETDSLLNEAMRRGAAQHEGRCGQTKLSGRGEGALLRGVAQSPVLFLAGNVLGREGGREGRGVGGVRGGRLPSDPQEPADLAWEGDKGGGGGQAQTPGEQD
ncbi:KH domain-containing, RNA-binding, signal transduction-associated protein 1-like protein [Lates japonicus]|uniref:KH domain-containing, RNA-binding, signal transduction-associated protein 1-like protein n=1 Tax=Lates japonicus TaxID=270547 RepID=A0AAD3MQV5_LATJO|nr:KH domain-containing, RNA-binding, signal transduction-associated protein 1-like protein [Lates japonicus]